MLVGVTHLPRVRRGSEHLSRRGEGLYGGTEDRGQIAL